MRIATWNINGLSARLPYLTMWLREVQPDVVGLQELKIEDDKFPHDAFAALGYTAVVHGQKAWNGVAVLARDPLERRQIGLPGQEALGARLLTVEADGLSFTTMYCPNGKSVDHDDYGLKLAWLDALGDYVEGTLQGSRTILCGDFNIVPAAIDSWCDPEPTTRLFYTDAERSRLRRLEAAGLHDIFREQCPEDPGFTWWDYRGGAFHKQQGLRIDLVLATADVAAKVRTVHVERHWRKKHDDLISSDHIPIWIDIDID